MSELTIEMAIAIQQAHLKQWDAVLKPEHAAALRKWAECGNDTAQTGYDISRGGDLDRYVHDMLMPAVQYPPGMFS